MDGEREVASLQWIELALSRIWCALAPTMHMIDVGAHVGTALEPFLLAGWNVDGFEPIEANRRQLAANFPAARNLTIRPEAVSCASGVKELHLALHLDGSLHEYHHSLETTREDAWHRKGPSIQVPTVSLDDLVRRGEIPARVGFLKIDTEGHDLAVLQGAGELTCDALSVEFWGDAHALGKSPSPVNEMIALLRQRGYECFIALCHDGDAVVARYSTLDGIAPDSWGNIVFFKDGALYERVRQHRDWRFVLEMADAFDHLRVDLCAKEATIQSLSAALAERLQLAERLERIAAERLEIIERLERTAAERLEIIERYHVLFKNSPRWKQMLAGAIGLWPKFSSNDAHDNAA